MARRVIMYQCRSVKYFSVLMSIQKRKGWQFSRQLYSPPLAHLVVCWKCCYRCSVVPVVLSSSSSIHLVLYFKMILICWIKMSCFQPFCCASFYHYLLDFFFLILFQMLQYTVVENTLPVCISWWIIELHRCLHEHLFPWGAPLPGCHGNRCTAHASEGGHKGNSDTIAEI